MSQPTRRAWMIAFAGLAAGFLPFGMASMAQEVDPADLVKDLHAIFGEHHARAVHTKGLIFEASFEPTAEARKLSKASVFTGKLAAVARLSDTTGIPTI